MRRIGCVTLFLFWLYFLPAQERVTLSGDVSDSFSKETLLGVTILIQELNTGTVTNNYGFYSISVPPGDYTISAKYLGYQTLQFPVSLTENIKQNILLTPSAEELDEVVLIDNTERVNIKNLK